VIPFLLWRRQLRLLFGWRHLLAATAGALVCLGWAAAVVAQIGWDPLAETVRREATQRLDPHRHGHSLGYHPEMLAGFPLLVLGACLPASALALIACRRGFGRLWDDDGRRLWQLLQCWLWPNLIFWTVVPQREVRYAFPIGPACGGLAAMAWLAWHRGLLPAKWAPAGKALNALVLGVCLWMVAKIAFVDGVVPARTGGRLTRETGAELAALVPDSETLYLYRFKDEGIMFYYGRPVLKRAVPIEQDRPASPYYAVLTADEWAACRASGRVRVVRWLRDQQGDRMALAHIE
jgi:hypothetical protein